MVRRLMVVDGGTFLRRAQHFFREMQGRRYPNATSLAKLCSCSRNTAQRTIYRLRDEYMVPLDYDSSEKGYFLVDGSYTFPTLLPPGKDELTALLLALDLVGTIGADDLMAGLEGLWNQFATNNSIVDREITPLSDVFSSDATVVADLADGGIIQYVNASRAGESVRIVYKSPWRHKDEVTYEGQILRVHFSDSSLYLLLVDGAGKERVLNASFVRKFELLDRTVAIPPAAKRESRAGNWLEGYGVWAGKELQQIRVEILPPAAEYYAAQSWHPDQEDSWDGEVLIRCFPGMVSPEITRRILSLGRHVRKVEPATLAQEVGEHARGLLKAVG